MKFSKHPIAVIGILLGMTGIVSCNSQTTRVSEAPTASNEAEYASCIEPTIAGYDKQDPTQVAQSQPAPKSNRNAQDQPPPDTADCILPELDQ
jgi:hypothetical protein